MAKQRLGIVGMTLISTIIITILFAVGFLVIICELDRRNMYYKDITWCVNKQCTKECDRRYTEEVAQEAKECGYLVCVSDFNCEDDNEKMS